MRSSSDSLLRSRFTRRTATVTISAPLASRARAVSWKDLYFPVPTIRRERKERPAMRSGSVMTFHCKPGEAIVEPRGCLRRRGGFSLRIKFVDLRAIAFFNYAAAQLHRGREGTIVGVEFIGD